MSLPVYVLDASVGVKWFRDEPGSAAAHELAVGHIEGRHLLAVDSLFYYEVLSVASRAGRSADVERVWRDLARLDLITTPPGDELISAAAAIRSECGCSLYDAFSAGLARLIGAELYSADGHAHAMLPGVTIIG